MKPVLALVLIASLRGGYPTAGLIQATMGISMGRPREPGPVVTLGRVRAG
jgi:hypothetical protein